MYRLIWSGVVSLERLEERLRVGSTVFGYLRKDEYVDRLTLGGFLHRQDIRSNNSHLHVHIKCGNGLCRDAGAQACAERSASQLNGGAGSDGLGIRQ